MPLSKRVDVYGTACFSVLRHHPMEISIPCAFTYFRNIKQNIHHSLEYKITRLLANTEAICGAIRSNKKVHVDFENN